MDNEHCKIADWFESQINMEKRLLEEIQWALFCIKVQKSIRRFSENIDLTICIDNCSGSQAKKRLETATKKYLSLPRTSRKELEDDRKGSITAVYDYTPAVTVDTDDPLQRFGYVKVKGTSFYERAMYFNVTKHIYDVGIMLDLQPI